MNFAAAQFLYDTAEPPQPDDREPQTRFLEMAEAEHIAEYFDEIRERALAIEDAMYERDQAEAEAESICG